VWSGFGQAKMTPAADPKTHRPYTIKEDGFRATLYEFVGQYGTHVDPPAHFDEKGITMDVIPLKQMILPLVVLDATSYLQKDPSHAFSVADLRAWEKKHGRIPRGSFVALRTDMYKDWDTDPERFKRAPFPAWSFETIKFLYEQRGAVATGHESLDTDTTDKMESETYILQHGHYQIEVMANLDKVPPKGALIVVTWPKVRNGLGFPARAFAILP
jgi:kynurenine formamidase